MIKPNMMDARIRTKNMTEHLEYDNHILRVFNGEKYFLRTYGCQMNVHDSEEIRAYLEALGLEETDDLEKARVVVLNTCAIRENAHDKVFGYLGRCKHLKEQNPNLIIAIGGCMSKYYVWL